MGLPWFSHESKANRDTKMKKLLMKYGAEGYGLYWYCVEHVADNVGPKLSFEVEHDSEILAHELKIDTLKVEEMMLYMVNIGLFERSEDLITCLSLLKHLTPNCTRNEKLQSLIREAKQIPVSVTVSDKHVFVSDSLGQSETVTLIGEDIREEKQTSPQSDSDSDFDSWYETYPKKTGKKKAQIRFRNLSTSDREAMLADDLSRRYGHREKRFIKGADVYLNERAWEDEYDQADQKDSFRGVTL